MTYLGLDDPQKRAISFLQAAMQQPAGGTSHSCGTLLFFFLFFFLFIYYFFIVDITQSHLYTYHIIITTKNV